MRISVLLVSLAVCGLHLAAAAEEKESALVAVFESKEPEQVDAWQSRQFSAAGEREQQVLACEMELKLQKPPVHCFKLDARQWSKIEAAQRVSRSQLDALCLKFAKNIATDDALPVFDSDLAVSSVCQGALQERRADLEYATRI